MLINKKLPSKVMRKLFLFIVFIIFILVVVESTVRIFFRVTNQNIEIYRNFSFSRGPMIYMPDNVLDYKLIPNVSRNAFTSDFQIIYKTNSLGLRDKEIEDTSKFKILFLGDSQTFGEGVPFGNRFSDLLEKEMENVYSINAGVPGYGIHNMFQYLKYKGVSLKPNLVVCAIISLDLNRAVYKKLINSPHLLTKEKVKEKLYTHELSAFNRVKKALLDHSYFYAFLRSKIKVWLLWHGLQERDRKEWEEIAQKGDGKRYKITSDNQKLLVREASFKIFKDFKDLLRDKNIELLVVNIDREPIPWLEDYCKQEHIDYLDISPALKSAVDIIFKIDPHYNERGNRIIADYLREYFLKRYPQYMEQ